MTKGDSVGAEPGDAGAVKIEDLAQLIAGMSRLLMVLQRARAFRKSGLGIAEWAALNVLEKQGALSVVRLGRAIGLPSRLAEPMVATLVRSNFVRPSETLDQGKIELTPLGQSEVTRVNALLHAQFADSLKDKQKLLSAASRTINRHLVPGLQQSNAEDRDDAAPSALPRARRKAVKAD